jgi:hypothetical protein
VRAAALLLAATTLGAPTLAVEHGGGWREWWRADRAPARWAAPLPAVAGAVRWQTARPGLEWGELRLSGDGEAWRIRAIVVRLDPALVRLRLDEKPLAPGRRGPPNRWTLEAAPAEAVLALNAGQFGPAGPWGWVVRNGVEQRAPGSGPLAPAVVLDREGRLRLVPPDSIAAERAAGRAVEAFQSYPTLLEGDGQIPEPLREAGRGVDLTHRDARLAVGELRDGRVLLVLTRFEALGGALANLPFGLTTPEMAALMGALGSRRAVLLDGGISSQLLLRTAAGATHQWTGMRNVPLGLVAVASNEPGAAR